MRRYARAVHVGVAVLTGVCLAAPAAAAPASPPVADAVYTQWHDYHSGKCLATWGGSMADNTHVIQYDCRVASNDQYWSIGTDGGYHYVTNLADSSMCLSVPDASMDEGAQLEIRHCSGSPDQLWSTTKHGSGYVLWNGHSGLVMGVAGGATNDAAAVVQWQWQAHPDQVWWAYGF
jgi:Ricin-type beta-trefoil lectin domain